MLMHEHGTTVADVCSMRHGQKKKKKKKKKEKKKGGVTW
jgi:hypothetical protein